MNEYPNIMALSVTLGKDGALVRSYEGFAIVPGIPTDAVDTTGAGDSFWGGFISAFLKSGKNTDSLSTDDLKSFAKFGNAAASLCVRKHGGIPAVPHPAEIEKLLKKTP